MDRPSQAAGAIKRRSAAGGAGRSGRIVLVELSPLTPNLGRFIVTPTFGMLAIASVLAERSNYEVTLLFERYVGRIRPEDVAEMEPFCVMTNGLTTTAPENEAFFRRFHDLTGGRIPVVAGGEHATMYPEDARIYADYLLTFEGDESVFPLLAALKETDPPKRDTMLAKVPGLHYRGRDGAWHVNANIARVENISYRYDFSIMPGAEGAGRRFRTARIPLQTSRGCRYGCSFCSWISLYGKPGYRVRPVDDVVHDTVHAMEYVGTRDFFVCDNLFAGDEAHVEELMHRMARAFEGKSVRPSMTVLMRADQLSGGDGSLSERMVALLAKGGVSIVSFGLESLSERSLIQMRKKMTLKKYLAAADMLRRHGISLLGTFASGFDGDSVEDVMAITDFAERMGLFTVQVYSRCITPGTVDYIFSGQRIIPGRPNRFANGHGVWVLPALMLPSELQKAMFDVAFQFHGRVPSRKPAYRVFAMIWHGLSHHLRALRRIEGEVLLPMGIYRRTRQGFRLDEDRLARVHDDAGLHALYRERCTRIFREEVEEKAADGGFARMTEGKAVGETAL